MSDKHLKRPTAPDRIYLVCSDCSTSGSVHLDVEDAHEEAKMLTQCEGVKWGVFPFALASSLPILNMRSKKKRP